MDKEYLKVIDDVNSCSRKGVNSTFSCHGDINIPMGERICFGSFTKYFNREKTEDITVRMFKKPFKDEDRNRYSCSFGVTPFTTDEIIQYLNDLRKIFPFEFEIKEHEVNEINNSFRVFPNNGNIKRDAIDVTYHISGPHIAFMFILSLQRFLYAHTDNYALALALEIKNGDYGFEKMNLFNILNCTISTITTSSDSRGGDMFHFDSSYFLHLYNSKDLQEMLLAREKIANEHKHGCIDLHDSMIYAHDPNLKKFPINTNNWAKFPGFWDKSYSLEEIIKHITDNITVLRKYNGFTRCGEEKRRLIKRNYDDVEDSDINYYPETKSGRKINFKVDESLLT